MTVFYVSPQGSDSASGLSTTTAFKTLAEAQAAMRASGGADTTYIMGGTYFLNSPLALTSADSNNTFAAYQGQTAVLSGGTAVTGWTQGANGIWSAHVDASQVQQFVVNGVQQTSARYGTVDPSNPLTSGWNWAQTLPSGDDPNTQMAYNKADFAAGQLVAGEKITVFSNDGYSSDYLTIKSVDTSKGVITFDQPATYEIGTNSRFFVSGSMGALDQTGEYYFDKGSQTIYYKAPAGFNGTGAVAAGGDTNLITVNGAQNITISGLTLTNATTTAETDDINTAAVNIQNSTGIVVNGNHFLNDAKGVLVSGSASSGNTISNNDFNHLWSEAVDLTPSTHENTVTNNTISNTGEVFATSGAIQMDETWGNTITHNTIQNVPRFGIAENNYDPSQKSGGNNISYNAILNSGQETPDVGAIYLYSHLDPNALGDTIDYNDIVNPGGLNTTKGAFIAGNDLGNGIYLDDYASNATIKGNFIQGASFAGVYLHGGANNSVTDNFILNNGKYGVELNQIDKAMTGTSVKNNIIQVSADGDNTVDLDPSYVSRSAVADNTYYSPTGAQPDIADVSYSAWRAAGGDAGSIVTSNPGFTNAAAGNYSLTSNAAALADGVVNLPWSQMGASGSTSTGSGSTTTTGSTSGSTTGSTSGSSTSPPPVVTSPVTPPVVTTPSDPVATAPDPTMNDIDGNSRNNTLTSLPGADALTGGVGADRFVYSSLDDSTVAASGRDIVEDFSLAQGDRIDLSRIDANVNAGRNQAFTFIGTSAFTGHAGQLDYSVVNGNAFVYGDVNGDGKADFSIEVAHATSLVKADFRL